MKELTFWSMRLLWPTLILGLWWSIKADLGLIFDIVAILMVVASILVGWWQRRIYLAVMSALLIIFAGLFAYLQNVASGSLSIIAVYIVLIYLLFIACFSAFSTYLLKVQKPMILAYLVGNIFICLELFWLLCNIAADPIIKAVFVAGLFHFVFSLIALYSWGKLKENNFRWYTIGAVIFFAIFIRLL